MIHFVYATNLHKTPVLAHNMFRDRAKQFSERLGWQLKVNSLGEERDEYDQLDPLYVIVSDGFGRHYGSMRFLPTTGRTMVNEHFLQVTDGVEIVSPHVWECTRFCISEHADKTTSAMLLAAGARLMKEAAIDHFVGVFEQRMEIIYRRIGAQPTVIGRSKTGQETIGVGLWEFDSVRYRNLIKKAGISELDMELFLANSDIYHTAPELGQYLEVVA